MYYHITITYQRNTRFICKFNVGNSFWSPRVSVRNNSYIANLKEQQLTLSTHKFGNKILQQLSTPISNFLLQRNAENPAFLGHSFALSRGACSNSIKYLVQKTKFHSFSLILAISPKIINFTRPGKCIFKFHDFSQLYESWLKKYSVSGNPEKSMKP